MLLVTGASGQLGSLIHARLLDQGLAPLAGTRDPARLGDLGRAMDFDDEASLHSDLERLLTHSPRDTMTIAAAAAAA
jgi:uncharacterized protein YbjT (DUF2867 family)